MKYQKLAKDVLCDAIAAVILLLILLALPSCKIVTSGDIKRAESACRAHGGLVYIRVAFSAITAVRCEDGAEFERLPDKKN